MGFKADTDFLRYLTMGAVSVRHVMGELRSLGFTPVELERSATSNKIWTTKIKRLRIPDVLCVTTGIRVEVKAKSKLELRMSHAPNNPDRHWDAGMRDEDLIAFISCQTVNGEVVARGPATYFRTDALRNSVDPHRLSRLKSASEGSEQDLSWPTIVTKRPGLITNVTASTFSVEFGGDDRPPRRHTYQLSGKRLYLTAGSRFASGTTVIAGIPDGVEDPRRHRGTRYDPLSDLMNGSLIDRYAAVRAIPARQDLYRVARPLLETRIGQDSDPRLALEVANAAAALNISSGVDFIRSYLSGHGDPAMEMEAVFVVTELGKSGHTAFATQLLDDLASDLTRFGGHEARQAAVWGLGRWGTRSYDRLVPYLADQEENVALHAIAAFGPDTPELVIDRLVQQLLHGPAATLGAITAALRIIATETVVRHLLDVEQASGDRRPWVISTIGKFPEETVRSIVSDDAILRELASHFAASPLRNWLAREDAATSFAFLSKQNL